MLDLFLFYKCTRHLGEFFLDTNGGKIQWIYIPGRLYMYVIKYMYLVNAQKNHEQNLK